MNFDKNIMVSIHCLVFNHEPYLRNCLDGFVMQKTNFKFEAIVHDDASKDGSAAIIREYAEKYPDIIKPIYQTENQWSKGNDILAKIMSAQIRGKYIAYCEGDDYWIDPLKLQKQVDILEEHPEIYMVHSDYDIVDENNNELIRPYHEDIKKRAKTGNVFRSILEKNHVLTCTTCFRRNDIFQKLYDESKSRIDISMFLAASLLGPVWYLPEKTAVYRINLSSVGHTGSGQQWMAEEGAKAISYYKRAFLERKGYKFSAEDELETKKHVALAEVAIMECRHLDYKSLLYQYPELIKYCWRQLFQMYWNKFYTKVLRIFKR